MGPTFEVLGRENDGTEVMVFNEAPDLRGHLGAIPPHDQALTNCPTSQGPWLALSQGKGKLLWCISPSIEYWHALSGEVQRNKPDSGQCSLAAAAIQEGQMLGGAVHCAPEKVCFYIPFRILPYCVCARHLSAASAHCVQRPEAGIGGIQNKNDDCEITLACFTRARCSFGRADARSRTCKSSWRKEMMG